MTETTLNDFNPKEYKKELSVYKNLTEELERLQKINFSLDTFLSDRTIFFLLAFILVVAWPGKLQEGFLVKLWISAMAAAVTQVILDEYLFRRDFFTNIISLGKFKETKKKIEDLIATRNESYARLQVLESKIRNYCETQIEEFFQENLYRKNPDGQEFEDSISKFSSMVANVSTVDLVTTKIQIKRYEDYLVRHSLKEVFQSLKSTKRTNPAHSAPKNLAKLHKTEPEEQLQQELLQELESEPVEVLAPEERYRSARKIENWEEINASKKLTGLKGEEVVVAVEQEFFKSIDRQDLADKVRHVSVEEGDGLGYDVLSFFENGTEKYIEVKSTKSSLTSPFYLSRNELSFLREHGTDSFIYRVLLSEDEPQIESHSSAEIFENNQFIPTQYIVKTK